MLKVYVASPMGFSEVTRSFMNEQVLPQLSELGLEVIDPWALTPKSEIDAAMGVSIPEERAAALRQLRFRIGERNHKGILRADILVANLDGQEMDSGTASEIGAAAIERKRIFAWRNDFRNAGELGAPVNLQVEYFILLNGGTVEASWDDLKVRLKDYITLTKGR